MTKKHRSNLPSYDGYHRIFDRVYGIVERRFEFEVHEVLETVFNELEKKEEPSYSTIKNIMDALKQRTIRELQDFESEIGELLEGRASMGVEDKYQAIKSDNQDIFVSEQGDKIK